MPTVENVMDETLLASKSLIDGPSLIDDERTIIVGSLAALSFVIQMTHELVLSASSDVVILPTAAAYYGATAAAVELAQRFESTGVNIEALMVTNRTSAHETYFAQRIMSADWVVFTDGSPLHVRSTLRETPVGDALHGAQRIVGVGTAVGSLFAEMIDPRGGAPTTGLGYRRGLVICADASSDQLGRTRQLLTTNEPLVVLGEKDIIFGVGASWRHSYSNIGEESPGES